MPEHVLDRSFVACVEFLVRLFSCAVVVCVRFVLDHCNLVIVFF